MGVSKLGPYETEIWLKHARTLPFMRLPSALSRNRVAPSAVWQFFHKHVKKKIAQCQRTTAQLSSELEQRYFNLPPYSPDFNSIEMAFSKCKALPRKTEVKNRKRALENHWTIRQGRQTA